MKTILTTSFVTFVLLVVIFGNAPVSLDKLFAYSHAGGAPDRWLPTVSDPVEYSYETLNNGTVKLTALNNGPNAVSGDLIREAVTYPQNGEILVEFSIQPGSTFTYIDDRVLPGKAYVYIFEYFDQVTSEYQIHFDTLTPVSDIPALGNFLLIAPYAGGDDEYDWLREGYTIVLKGTNIQAEANADKTGSVVFYLNGKQSRDNTAPFALFPENKGDFKKGHLKNGDYTLTAIAYPQKNGKGTPGDTLTVNFSVDNIYEIENVHIYPNPVSGNSTVLIEGPANATVSIEVSELSGSNRKTIFQGTLDNTGTMNVPVSSADFKKGIYLLRVNINGELIQKRLLVE